jgi:hypothetical protein
MLGLFDDVIIQPDIKFSVRVGYINCSRNTPELDTNVRGLDLVAVKRTFVQMKAVGEQDRVI